VNISSSTWLSRLLNLVGAAVVTFYLVRDVVSQVPLWLAILSFLSVLGWVLYLFIPRRFVVTASVVLAIMVVPGALSAAANNGLTVAPVVVAIIGCIALVSRPLWQGVVFVLLGVALIPVGALFSPIEVLALVAMEAGVALATLGGISRRQFRASEAQSRMLLEERLATREEQARGAALAERQAVARDIHDVLAHSLGGLVIQLDAVEALLEAGRPEEAQSRTREARKLAASGLDEARRAVAALREPRNSVTESGESLQTALEELAEVHRALGGDIRFETIGEPRELGVDEAHALRRAFQEALSNARKHATGVPVSATVSWSPDEVDLEIVNPLGRAASGTVSGGHGLVGMRERFDALPQASISAGARDDRFVLSARVGRS
jgi:signal transduction histidine kinase